MKGKHLLSTLFLACLAIIPTLGQWTSLGHGGITASNHRLWGLSVSNSNIVWGVTYDYVGFTRPDYLVKTSDGGATWAAIPIDDVSPELYTIQVFVLDETTGWLATADELNPISGKVYKTTDGGETWVEQSTGFTEFNETPAALHFWDAETGVAFGATCFQTYNDQIAIYTTDDGGDTWAAVSGEAMPVQLPGEGMCVNSGNGFFEVVGDNIWFLTSKNRVFRSTDRGRRWEAYGNVIAGAANPRLVSLAFKDEWNGIAISNQPNKASRTTDGGLTWTPVSIPGAVQANQIEYIPGTEGSYLVRNAPIGFGAINMLLTNDDGDTWELLPVNENLYCFEILSPTLAFGGGIVESSDAGGIYRWDGGAISGRLYVDHEATGAGAGYNWEDAFTNLQDALAAATEGDEIWVAGGVYRPAGPGGSREASFIIDKNLKLFGGFVGTERNLSERGEPAAHPTILSGDLNGDDVEGDFETSREDNAWTVLTINAGLTNATLIDGFTFRGGHADGGEEPFINGGGIRSNGNPIIRNCRFTQNFAYSRGGGLFFRYAEGEMALVDNCTFDGNLSNRGGASDIRFSNVAFSYCTFTNNRAIATLGQPSQENGGAIMTQNSNCSFLGCSFSENFANFGGGGLVYWVDGQGEGFFLEMDSCFFDNNLADTGGAFSATIFGQDQSVTLANSEFTNNHCTGGFGNVAIHFQQDGAFGNALVDHCLFEGNTSERNSAGLDIGSGPGAAPSEYTITQCTFRDNTAQTRSGALTLWSEVETEAVFRMEHCLFEGNRALTEAGALSILNGSDGFRGTISYCEFIGNESPSGAAIAANAEGLATPAIPIESRLVMDNCLIAENRGEFSTLWIDGFPDFQLFNCTVAANASNGIALADLSGLTLQNNILYNPGFAEFEDWTGDVGVLSNGGNLAGDNSLDAYLQAATDQSATDPLLEHGYQLAVNSPAVDAGINYEGMPAFDLAGAPRLQGAGVDVGAFESPFPVGAREALAAEPLGLSPNPAAGYLRLELPAARPQPFQLELLDARGRLVRQLMMRGGELLNVETLPSGVYWVKAVAEGSVYAGKFVKR